MATDDGGCCNIKNCATCCKYIFIHTETRELTERMMREGKRKGKREKGDRKREENERESFKE